VLGPIVTDIFPGYDHITSAIGAAVAAQHGASFLCYVTPAEHLTLPDPEDVKAGCVAYRIAAHSADVARKVPGARNRDDALSAARANLDWARQFELAFDGETARDLHRRDATAEGDYCSMCGRKWCAVRLGREVNQALAGGKS
jgi:phosphomethylpyrimidine synthase